MSEARIIEQLAYWREQVGGNTLACGFTDDFAGIHELAAELDAMAVALEAGDAVPAQDAFFKELSFGTAGLRGLIGAGTNRMNIYTVARATQGLADYLKRQGATTPRVAIARDSRHKGELFVHTAASVLAANGIAALIFPRVAPTPALSFAVRDLGCAAGINMTASHNPAAYSGYKVYGPDGCQIASEAAAQISAAIASLDYFAQGQSCARSRDFAQAVQEGLISWIEDTTLERYIDAVLAQSLETPEQATAPLSVLYTPLCGTGLECTSVVLKRIGGVRMDVVAGQDRPDGDFPTCPSPNPEEREALEAGIAVFEAAKDENQPYDLLLATDPDADRVGVACDDGEGCTLLTGNEIGILLLDYIARTRVARGEDLSSGVAVTTIVSAAMADAIAQDYGFELRRILTGFKYIGSLIGELEAAGQQSRFLFGFEESYGYLAGVHVRDKDAVVASMLICQMARYWRAQGKTLVGALADLYARYGWWVSRTVSLSFPGADGDARMKAIMAKLRADAPQSLAGREYRGRVDYASDDTGLPRADVVELRFEGDAKVIVRPSGTEPKIKLYLFAREDSREAASVALDTLEVAARDLLQ